MVQIPGFSALSLQSAAIVFGVLLGVAFGIMAERSKFCLRRGLVGAPEERSSALAVWALALAVAIVGTTVVAVAGLIDFTGHRFIASRIPVPAIVAGGLLFGVGMVLARGCASRLTVLAGTGNLRAVATLLVFAVLAHATLKGALAPARVWLQSFAVDAGSGATLAGLPGGAALWSAALIASLLVFVAASRTRLRDLAYGAGIGALVPLGWLVTGYLLRDEFDPLPLESLAFTSAATDGLFWWIAGTAVAPTFGVGLLGGVLAGSVISALVAGRFAVAGFTAETKTGRYLAGGALMGIGGVLAGGCTIGAGLSGISALSVAAMLALAAIIAGALITNRVLATSKATPGSVLVPAE